MSTINGITGQKTEASVIKKMIQKAQHRGPDNIQIKELDNGCLGTGELSLSSRSTAAMAGDDKLTVLLDGELYNSLPADKSNADFIKESYAREGKSCFSKLDGIFSCAIQDKDETILVRDGVGSRPLIYQTDGKTLYFASEAKSLIEHTATVKELPPAHYFSTSEGLKTYNPYTPSAPSYSSPEEAIKILEELLVKAVKKRMADKAVKAVSLSGGLDSSIIASIAKTIDPAIKLFSTTIKRYPSKDIGFAKEMAAYLGLEHEIYEITDEDISSFLSDAVWYMETFDEDCISGAIANYFTSKMIAKHTNCIVCGEGADELFGGYFKELKAVPSVEEKERIAKKLVQIAYNSALRRLDRGWMANSVNYRTPFLDPEVVAFSNKVNMDLKVHYDKKKGAEVEKWILREAFKKWLPESIYQRSKMRFAGGTGVDDLMDQLAGSQIKKEEFEQNQTTANGLQLNSSKELHYYRLFREHFPKDYESLVARWDPFK